MVLLALVLAGIGGWGIARLPSAFIPNEDQGYLMVARAAARRRLARPHRQRARGGRAHRQGDTGRAPGRGDHRRVDARQHGAARQCRRRLRHARRLGHTPQEEGPGPPLDRQQPAAPDGQPAGRPRHHPRPAADPGHRQCRRLPDAGRAARRQLRSRQAAGRDRRGDRAGRAPRPRSPIRSPASAPVRRTSRSRSTAPRPRA